MSKFKAEILLVDDDAQALESMRKILELEGHSVVTAVDGQAALDLVRSVPGKPRSRFDLVVSDVRMPGLGGLEFLRALSVCGDETPVILMTAFGRVEEAVWAMKFGAADFLTKPFKRQALVSAIEMALKRAHVRGRSASGASTAGPASSSALVGRSQPMRELESIIRKVGPTVATVLIQGESGTGKEMIARRIHEESPRAASGRFVAINCAAVPEHLIESELFGFEKGAFTGASNAKEGLLESAHGGTFLLDEVGDMPLSLQAKLLRVLQEGEVRRIGANTSRKIDVRVIAATHRDLAEAVRTGQFRQDLLYRLEVVTISVPPLRERMEDIPDLANYFLRVSSERHEKRVVSLSEEAFEVLLSHSWPGNVRELSNVIERAVVFAQRDQVTLEDLPAHLRTQSASVSQSLDTIAVPLGTTLKNVEELLIRKTLEATSGDKQMTAKLLGINSRTIYRKLQRETD
ncbi:MAG: sigma-54 dependent transcriptional regulator [Oligoflexia bacterium]|nr:sigma-54 dependent transcriptional regulator [Oligoflexia bacterium]